MEPMDKVTVEQRLAAIEEKLDLVLARLGTDFGAGSTAHLEDVVPTSDTDPEILELVRRGKKIQAIKVYRERTGVGLREAKDAVDRLDEQERFRSGRR
ncbi:ribosomal protein L7/L12 [Streptacidiphilus jiangxiensis]|uniref:Ribosomal protein L7/L12 C-terminal domain-containing protein n=1 Tax=Streptacidiphilus jiangxiensis TaxID=235985 RepID=A0A1H7XBG3_STRJI|nr:ribosomal protein L7/L12 [Streptacidiphilus jiangxiensis]SEM30498.1 Ribosomal protein L7/L12 C-terminal domain-containing protein [Streptacidiphilus jiangxiensis]